MGSKKSQRYFLISALDDTKVDLKEFAKVVNEKEVRNGDEELLSSLLGCKKGNISPFGLLVDTQNKVSFYLDSRITPDTPLLVHPMANDMTLQLKAEDLFSYIDRPKTVLDFSNLAQ